MVQNKLYCYGHGLSTVNHCRIRLGLSHLYSHLHHYNLIDSPSCSNPECGRTPESVANYFLSYPRYNNERRVLFETLLDASYKETTLIIDEVFKYIY